MIENLFIYGTLGPNRPNEHIMKEIGGSWKNATVRGILKQEGWGAKMGYPAIILDKNANEVEGFIFISKNLSNHWKMLDKFEGAEYERIITQVKLENDSIVDSYIYALKG